MRDAAEAVLRPAGEVVQRHAVQVRGANDGLAGVAGARAGDDGGEGEPAERSPGELRGRRWSVSCWLGLRGGKGGEGGGGGGREARTTVMVSTQTVKTSEVRYRESEIAYSFQSWANRVFMPAMLRRL